VSTTFGQVYGDPFDQAYFDANNPVKLATAGNLNSLAIYFDCGAADRYDAAIAPCPCRGAPSAIPNASGSRC
jgi:hypothetical protein